MKALLSTACIFTASFSLFACAASQSESSASEDVSTSEVNAAARNFRDFETALGLIPGLPADATIMNGGNCMRAFNLPPPQDSASELQVQTYKNGVIVKRVTDIPGEATAVCIDLHDHKISLSGVTLDAVLRYSLGKIVGVRHTEAAATEVDFENGTLRSFKVGSDEQLFALAKADPKTVSVNSAAPSILGMLDSIVLKNVNTTTMNRQTTPRDMTIQGEDVWMLYRFSLEEDVVGKFKRSATAMGDVVGGFITWNFEKVDVRHEEIADMPTSPGQTVMVHEGIGITAPGTTAQLATCKRVFDQAVLNSTPGAVPSYQCMGVGF